jgi:hypothetical protein
MNRWRTIAVLLLLPLAACTPDYPMDKAGTWQPPAVSDNDRNLRVMIVNPQDLVAGTGEDNSTAAAAAPPVHRLLTGHRAELPPSNAAEFQIMSAPAPAGGAGGAGGAPAQ